ncbi:DUF192 domain-containing protein [Paracidobacterium acidisoli]|uniref:DUF192 domain-containing protein n=1 Tax=Paracidobacterium acidisoli TaxID=2303751 RepID=A0A372IN21_9BACT|nr:DUF192 domain-containing protein [Paracidobacterium acidisoli]MBT9331968.1 DUF192 domain-containing protein [Paracidobacterium acidisoli]
MKSAVLFVSLLAATITACSQEPRIPYAPPRPANTAVTLPDGAIIHAELADTEAEREYGLMGRIRLPEDRGMLFTYDQPGRYGYWMYHCEIGLDIVWIDENRHIVEISENTPPCKGKASSCQTYGGHMAAMYVLELPAGSAKKHYLRQGQEVKFNAP